jgi:hypothetical protein
MLVIAFTNVSKIYILGKQDYKKSKKRSQKSETKSRKEKLSNWHSGKKILSSMYRYIENYYVPNGY